MRTPRRRPTALLGVVGLLTAAVSVAGAGASPAAGVVTNAGAVPRTALAGGPDSCGDNDHVEQQGGTAGTVAKVCQGGGPVFIGPAVGQVAVVIGPTVIGPAQVNAVVGAGDAILGV
jgi:hypothetical protein